MVSQTAEQLDRQTVEQSDCQTDRQTVGLTAGPSSEHGDGFKQHLVKEQSDRLVEQLVPQQEAVVDDVAPLRGDGYTLHAHTCRHTHKQLKGQEQFYFLL